MNTINVLISIFVFKYKLKNIYKCTTLTISKFVEKLYK